MNEWLDQVNIRLMTAEDLPGIEWDGFYARYRNIYKEVFRNSLTGKTLSWIAETEQDGIVGQVFLTKKPPHPHFNANKPYMFLSSFRVKPNFRGRGLGTLLLKICEISTSDRGIPAIYLNCSQKNLRSRAFYERNGFKVLREDPGEWSYIDHEGLLRREVEPAWTMVKKVG